MSFFSRVKSKAIESLNNAKQSVKEKALEIRDSNLLNNAKQSVSNIITSVKNVSETIKNAASDMIQSNDLSNDNNINNNDEEILRLYKSIIQILDTLSDRDDATSPEVDRLLYESKVRSHLKLLVNILQCESDEWLSKYNENSDPELIDLPCINAFLECHMMHELCSRAVKDIPKGCLPLILGSVASLLRHVRYPLLPHQSVYKPVERLISISCRFDAIRSSTRGGYISSKQETITYKKRVEIGLTTLIGVVWKKITENPPILDIFTFTADKYPRVINSMEGHEAMNHYHMDVLTALFPLLWKPRVGTYAKEALLTAINMHDQRIDTFILKHTNLTEILVMDICKRYNFLFESFTNNTTQLSIVLATSTPSHKQRQGLAETANVTNKGNKLPSYIAMQSPSLSNSPLKLSSTNIDISTPSKSFEINETIDQFCNSVRLFDAIVSAASNDIINITNDDDDETTSYSLQSILLDSFSVHFLQGVINKSFSNNPSEQQTLAATIIVRNLLEVLSTRYYHHYH